MRILFVCYANACRSQMAEGYARRRFPAGVDFESAGLIAAGVHPRAARSMQRIGIDISRQRSRCLDEVELDAFDVVVTLSDIARGDVSRRVRAARHVHWPIGDPVGVMGSEREQDRMFDRTRDDICARIDQLCVELAVGEPPREGPNLDGS